MRIVTTALRGRFYRHTAINFAVWRFLFVVKTYKFVDYFEIFDFKFLDFIELNAGRSTFGTPGTSIGSRQCNTHELGTAQVHMTSMFGFREWNAQR